MLSPESALILSSRRVVTTWNAEQLRHYAALEGVDLVRLQEDRRAEDSVRSTLTSKAPVAPYPLNHSGAVARRARSLYP